MAAIMRVGESRGHHDEFGDSPDCRSLRPLSLDSHRSGTLLMLGAAAFDVARFSVNTDIEGLISQRSAMAPATTGAVQGLPAKRHRGRREGAHGRECRTGHQRAGAGAVKKPEAVSLVGQPDSGDFFERNGLLFDDPADVKKSVAGTDARAGLSFPCWPPTPACAG